MNENFEYYLYSSQSFGILIIVNESTIDLGKLANEMVLKYALHKIAPNNKLGQILVSELKQTRGSKAIEWIRTKSDNYEGPILFCDIDIIFEPDLEIDPLALFKRISKHKKIIVLWPGNFSNNSLTYATPEHAHFRRWVNPGVEIIQL